MKNFWKKLKKPFFVQAPMDDVTDTVFRQIITICGKPDVFFTEFANVEGMCSKGKDKVGKRLIYAQKERPIVAQIWGLDPLKFEKTAEMAKKMGFDGIDINMGCPEKSAIKKGACGALINNPKLAKEIIEATKKGTGGLPVSVKTRIGFKDIQTKNWIGFLLEQNLDVLTIHGRTVAEMSDVPAHWDEIDKAVKLKNKMKKKTLIIGNGDVKSLKEAKEKYEKYGVDGIMIGRGIFNNLWIYNESVDPSKVSHKEKLKLLIKHINLFDKTWGKTKNFSLLKKFYRVYVSGHPDAKNLRVELMKLNTYDQTLNFLNSLLRRS